MSVSEPQGQVLNQQIAAGDNVSITCSVDFYGPETPYIEWTDDTDEVVSGATEWIESDNYTNPDNVISVRVSELNVFVPDEAEYLPPYTCSVRFYSYNERPQIRYYRHPDPFYFYQYYENVYTPYNWTSPEIKVSCK